jgi:hypothetical protein
VKKRGVLRFAAEPEQVSNQATENLHDEGDANSIEKRKAVGKPHALVDPIHPLGAKILADKRCHGRRQAHAGQQGHPFQSRCHTKAGHRFLAEGGDLMGDECRSHWRHQAARE